MAGLKEFSKAAFRETEVYMLGYRDGLRSISNMPEYMTSTWLIENASARSRHCERVLEWLTEYPQEVKMLWSIAPVEGGEEDE